MEDLYGGKDKIKSVVGICSLVLGISASYGMYLYYQRLQEQPIREELGSEVTSLRMWEHLEAAEIFVNEGSGSETSSTRERSTSSNTPSKHLHRLLDAITSCSTTTTLDLSSIQIGDDGVEILIKHFLHDQTSLTEINMSGNNLTDRGIELLAPCIGQQSKLAVLNLSHNLIGPIGFKCLRSLLLEKGYGDLKLDLSMNRLGDRGASLVGQMLEKVPRIQELDLNGNDIGDLGAMSIASGIQFNIHLQKLNLGSNSIGDKGARIIRTALETNTTLTHLWLHSNSIAGMNGWGLFHSIIDGDSKTPLEYLSLSFNQLQNGDIEKFCEALADNTRLRELDLGFNKLGQLGANKLSKSLKKNSCLSVLDLTNNELGPNGALHLVSCLLVNSTLRNLNLNGNNIGDEGASGFFEALCFNEGLTVLNLTNNDIGPSGARLLSGILRHIRTLRVLVLTENRIQDKGALYFAETLQRNVCLVELHLCYNGITDEGANALMESVKCQTALTICDLTGNDIDPDLIRRGNVTRSIPLFYS